MNTISYCTTCKGRLWQLRETLRDNLKVLSRYEGVDLVLLNYNSEDGLEDFIYENFSEQLNSGLLKYYSLQSSSPYFDMSYAKNIVHSLATGEVLFNLDADNFIGETVSPLQNLKKSSAITAKASKGAGTSMFGRIGVFKEDFYKVRGYNEGIEGLGGDDGDFVRRLVLAGITFHQVAEIRVPLQNTPEDKAKFEKPDKKNFVHLKDVNTSGFGRAIVKNLEGKLVKTGA